MRAGRFVARAVVLVAPSGKAFAPATTSKEMIASPRLGCITQPVVASAATMMLSRKLPVPVIARCGGVATAAGCQLVAHATWRWHRAAQFAVSAATIYGLFCATPVCPAPQHDAGKQAMEMLVTGGSSVRGQAWSARLVNRVAAGRPAGRRSGTAVGQHPGQATSGAGHGQGAVHRQRNWGRGGHQLAGPDHGREHDGRLRSGRVLAFTEKRPRLEEVNLPMTELDKLLRDLAQPGGTGRTGRAGCLPGAGVRRVLAGGSTPGPKTRSGSAAPWSTACCSVAVAGADLARPAMCWTITRQCRAAHRGAGAGLSRRHPLLARVFTVAFPASGLARLVERLFSWLAWIAAVLWIDRPAAGRHEGDGRHPVRPGKVAKISLLNLVEGVLWSGVVLVLALWISAALEKRTPDRDGGRPVIAQGGGQRVARGAAARWAAVRAVGRGRGPDNALSVLGGALGVGLGFWLQ